MSDENRYGNVAETFCALLSVCDDEFRFAVPSEVPFAMRREFLVYYEIFQRRALSFSHVVFDGWGWNFCHRRYTHTAGNGETDYHSYTAA